MLIRKLTYIYIYIYIYICINDIISLVGRTIAAALLVYLIISLEREGVDEGAQPLK